MSLPDIQDEFDARDICLDQVGVTGVRYPIQFNDGTTVQRGVASFDLAVTLPGNRRGTHMSRMIEVIQDQLQVLDPARLPQVLKVAGDKLEVEAVRVVVSLPVGFVVRAPESGREAQQVCDVTIAGQMRTAGSEIVTTVATDVMSVCPCSKAISDYGAHNQRSLVTLSAFGSADDAYPLEVAEAFGLIRAAGSFPVYPLVKRVDERVVTMQAHDHPAFVEDIARDLSQACRARGLDHQISVRNLESIHSHDAIAVVQWRG